MVEFNVHLKQQSVNEFLPAEGESQHVFTNVCSMCGKATMDIISTQQ